MTLLVPPQLLYGLGAARVILATPSGNTERITLQSSDAISLQIIVTPEGIINQLGSGSSFRKDWTARNLRVSMRASWSYSLPAFDPRSAYREVPSGSDWITPTSIENAEAIRRILSSAMRYPCTVIPHLDSTLQSFSAQPMEHSVFSLNDDHRVVHGKQTLELIACAVGPFVDWEV